MSTIIPSTRSEIISAHIFCVAQQFCAVVVYVLGKEILQYVGVSNMVFMRLLFVIPTVIIFASLMTRKASSFKIPIRPILWMVLSGIVGLLLAQTLMFTGLDKSTATNTSIISAPCTPLFTSLFSVIRGTDKMNVGKGVGFLSSIAGAMLLLQVWNFQFEGTTLGNLLIVASSVCSAANSLIQKHVLNGGYHPLVVQTYVVISGALMFMVAYTPFGLFDSSNWILTTRTWIYVSVVGIIATGLPWCLGIIALKHTSPMTTSVYVVLQPLIAVLVGFVLKGEVLTWVQMLGSALVLLGLVCVNATPVVERFVKYLAARASTNKSKQFDLLITEEEREVELQVLSESSEGSTNEVNYELGQGDETNAFIIDDDEKEEKERKEEKADYKSDTSSTTAPTHHSIIVSDDVLFNPLKNSVLSLSSSQPIMVA